MICHVTVGPLGYPHSRRMHHTDEYFGQKVKDEFRWLEDPDSDDTKRWVDKQIEFTESYFGKRNDLRSKLHDRLLTCNSYERMSTPMHEGDNYFYFHNEGLQNQAVLYKMPRFDAFEEAEVMLDLNKEYPDGKTSLSTLSFTDDGSLLAYTLSFGGSDWNTIKVMSVADGKKMEDHVPWVKFSSIEWNKDGTGFFYACYPAPQNETEGSSTHDAGTETNSNDHHMIKFHALGTDSSHDKLVYVDYTQQNVVELTITDDYNYLIVAPQHGCDPVNRLYYVDLRTDVYKTWLNDSDTSKQLPLVKLVDNFDALYSYVTNKDNKFYFRTNLDASRYRLISIEFPSSDPTESDLQRARDSIQDVLKERKIDVLKWVLPVGQTHAVVCHVHDVTHSLTLHDFENMSEENSLMIELPGPGTIAGASGSHKHTEFFFKFVSFTTPCITFMYNVDETSENDGKVKPGTKHILWEAKIPGFNSNEYESWQEFATAKDGKTKIPYFVIRKKTKQSNPGPCMLYGYGGFNVSLFPFFSPARLVWLDNLQGTLVIANIRGGGEYGDEWHKAGIIHNKQNCFDDFCCVGDDLIAKGLGRQGRIACHGGSNGGLLVLACALQRPDLFRAVIAQVPVTDMLRFHKFTIGHAWCTDYGCAEKSKEEFNTLFSYSPLHNVKLPTANNPLPAILICTADHDDRVVPLHSFKMTATLQMTAGTCEHQKRPFMIRVDKKAGHGAGKALNQRLEEEADMYTFAHWELS